jgi:hypothetical protein
LEPCTSCPSMLAENANLGNPVSQHRLKVTKEVSTSTIIRRYRTDFTKTTSLLSGPVR